MSKERDEFMAYQILLGLEQRLAGQHKNGGAGRSFGDGEALLEASLTQQLQRRAELDAARIGAALRWTLEPNEPNTLKPVQRICDLEEWRSFSNPLQPDPEHVLVICGPAHVEALRHRLEASMGASRPAHMFLARNAGLFPRLLINATAWNWEPVSPKAVLSLVSMEEGNAESAPTATPGPDTLGRLKTYDGLGPLATMVSSAWEALGPSSTRPMPTLSASAGPVFVHERLRSLSQKPLPMWPVFLVMYFMVPALAFLVIPIAIDMRWLQAFASGPEFPETLRVENLVLVSKLSCSIGKFSEVVEGHRLGESRDLESTATKYSQIKGPMKIASAVLGRVGLFVQKQGRRGLRMA